MLWSLNKTLGFKPTNPHFIVQVEAEYTKHHYEKADLSNVWQTHKQGTLKWHDEWQDQNRWGGEHF